MPDVSPYMWRIARALLALALVVGCDSATKPRGSGKQPASAKVDFTSLAVGQQSSYLGFVGQEYRFRQNLDYEYSGDTLMVAVVAETDTGFVIREWLTPGSTSMSGAGPIHKAGEIHEWVATIDGDELRATPMDSPYLETYLLWNYRSALSLAPLAGVEADVISWITSIPYCECYTDGHVVDYTQLGIRYPRLNLVVDDRPMATDLNGLTFIYSGAHGFVRTSSASWWTQEGRGWDLR